MKPDSPFCLRWPAPARAAVALLCAFALVASALPAWGQQAAPPQPAMSASLDKPLVAVLDMAAVGATAAQASALTDRLREALLNSGRYTLVDRSQMKAILNEQAFQQTGCTSQECAVQVGQILGVRKIITSKVTKAEAGLWLLSAQMIDVETAQTLAAVSVQYKGDYAGVLSDGIDLLAAKLTGETPPVEKMVKTAPTTSPQAAAAPPKPKPAEVKKQSGGMPWWGWALIGVGVVGVAAAASHKKGGSSGGSNSGGVTISW